MNILFFLTPKKDVEYIYDDFTIRQALEKMEYYHYSMIPVINKQGKYVSSLSDADLLWYVKDHKLNYSLMENTALKLVKPFRVIKSITIDKDITDLIELITVQNFVPVVDDYGNFIGIVTRKSVISYMAKELKINLDN
jgi:CBS domain-containing protein